ncbi:MAG: single-stranded DNA-binding protein [Saprospiraceae bacterium]
MVNKVTLIGNLGRDPEIRRLESGSAVGKFSLATNESYKDKNGEWQTQTEWHDIVVWRNLAERAERDLKKGKLIYVEGKLTHRKWQDKEGNDRYNTEVVANSWRLLEKREGSGNFNNSNFPTQEPAAMSSTPATSSESSASADTTTATEEDKDDLPF